MKESLIFHIMELTLLLPMLVQPTMQDHIYFSAQPSSYYYSSPGFAVVIPCLAYHVQPDDSEVLLNATFYRNSIPIYIYDPPANHHIHFMSDKVIGLIIVPVQEIDSRSQYYCKVGSLSSQVSTLYLGDGLPLNLVSPPVQIFETLYSVTISWGFTPTPEYAPLIGYNITLESHNDRVIMEIRTNETEFELLDLVSGLNYTVTIQGWNALGRSPISSPLIISSIKALPPPPPTQVVATFENGIVYVIWKEVEVELDLMTPLSDYLISYGIVDSTHQLTATSDNLTTIFKLFIDQYNENLEVGVASRNSIGSSSFTYTLVTTEILKPETTFLNSLEVIVVLAGGGGTLILLTLFLLLMISMVYCLRNSKKSSYHITKQKSSKYNDSSSTLSSPCSISGRANVTPTLQVNYDPLSMIGSCSSPSSTSIELHEYCLEPRKAGSVAPGDDQPNTIYTQHTTFR